jgi:hypothetical protein
VYSVSFAIDSTASCPKLLEIRSVIGMAAICHKTSGIANIEFAFHICNSYLERPMATLQ